MTDENKENMTYWIIDMVFCMCLYMGAACLLGEDGVYAILLLDILITYRVSKMGRMGT